MSRSRLLKWILLPVLSVLAVLSVWLGGDFTVRYAGAIVLVLVLPGFGLTRCWLGPTQAGTTGPSEVLAQGSSGVTILERIVLSLGASYAVAVAATLMVHYVPGPFTLRVSLPIYFVAAVGPWALSSVWATTPGRPGVDSVAGSHVLSSVEATTQGRRGIDSVAGSHVLSSVKATTQGCPNVESVARRGDPVWSPDQPSAIAPDRRRVEFIALLAVLLLAGGLFFFHLGTSEFQGDETMNLFDAGSAIRGDDMALFFHRKGPAEIALPMALWGLSGSITETSARLPFAWAGLLAVAGVYLLGRRLAGHWVGLVTAALLALNGFVIGFSRIVQYQSVVIMASALAVLCFCVFHEEDHPRLQVLGALFLALALLAHYDGVFALPPVAYLYGCYARRAALNGHAGSSLRRSGPALIAALVVGFVLLVMFYGPVWRSGSLAQTSEYLSFRSGGRLFYDNLSLGWWINTTYNSTYYVIFLAAAVLAVVVALTHWAWSRAVIGVCLIGILSVVAVPGLWTWRDSNLAFLPFLLTAVVFYCVLRPSLSLELPFVWFVVPFLVYNFFGVKKPGTHFWTLYSGLILLAAVGLAWLWRRLPNRLAVGSLIGSVALLGPLFGYYAYIVFLGVEPDYRASYPATKPALYWTTYTKLPAQDFFGFPHQAGWKAIGALYARNILQGEYDSNEGGEITTWYVPDGPRYACKPMPKYYFLAESVMDPIATLETLAADFVEVGQVTVRGRPGIHIYQRKGTGLAPEFVSSSVSGGVQSVSLEDWTSRFDLPRPPWDHLIQMARFVRTPLATGFGEQAELLGYDLDAAQARPGGRLALTLYWRRHGPPIVENYKVFVHLEKDRLWASADDVPGCGIWPTTAWRENEVIADRHVLDLPANLPAGEMPLSVGLYRADTGARLAVRDAAGRQQGGALVLTKVPVQR
jgi:4-amino-4-deoxy-L-arabinose transferase-like glycosyltransferase